MLLKYNKLAISICFYSNRADPFSEKEEKYKHLNVWLFGFFLICFTVNYSVLHVKISKYSSCKFGNNRFILQWQYSRQ